MKPEDLKKAPKMFCESVNVAFTQEYFVLGFTSGSQANIYSMTPQHVKRLQQYLEHQVKEFETKNGEIDAKWDPKIVSPVQRANPPSDLS